MRVGVIREQHRAVFATTRHDGTPQMSPVLVAVDDDGRALVSIRETAAKVRNLRRDPRSWLCVLPDGFFGRWVQVEGLAEIVYLPEAMDGLEDLWVPETRLISLTCCFIADGSAA